MRKTREPRYPPPWRERLAKATAQAPPMSRKDRFEALFRFYTEEGERYEALNKRAAAYLTVLGGLAVVAVFKLDSVVAKILASPATLWLGLAAGVATIGAVVFVALLLRIADYQTLVDPQELILTSDRENYTEEDLYTVLLGGLAEATSINRGLNDHRAGKLQTALWFAVTAAILVIATNLSIYLLLTTEVQSGIQTSPTRQQAASTPAPK